MFCLGRVVGAAPVRPATSQRTSACGKAKGWACPAPAWQHILQYAQPGQQRLDANQKQHDTTDSLSRSTVLVAEQGTDLHADGRQQAGGDADERSGRMIETCIAAKLTPTAKASMLVAIASGSMALAE